MAKPKAERPNFREYGISTKSKGMLDWMWAEEKLVKSRNYWICSTRPNGSPHSAPVWGVWMDSALYFSSAESSAKATNLKKNPAVSMHLESGDEVVIVEGKAVIVRDKAALTRLAKAYEAKYPGVRIDQEPFDKSPVFVVAPSIAYAWSEESFPNTATRWKFD
jgi:nitroimidazol reductase NimA-like FMN-containing flavoprotein (pyridoxamine 5'-phosphate oxidase superfamily)